MIWDTTTLMWRDCNELAWHSTLAKVNPYKTISQSERLSILTLWSLTYTHFLYISLIASNMCLIQYTKCFFNMRTSWHRHVIALMALCEGNTSDWTQTHTQTPTKLITKHKFRFTIPNPILWPFLLFLLKFTLLVLYRKGCVLANWYRTMHTSHIELWKHLNASNYQPTKSSVKNEIYTKNKMRFHIRHSMVYPGGNANSSGFVDKMMFKSDVCSFCR